MGKNEKNNLFAYGERVAKETFENFPSLTLNSKGKA